ncbi:MAG: hypothetical protein KAT75_05090 [Dehalococcoidia bacterium]|nr:hypothetical protein [Dehalococcoidia bacterium]
MVEQLMPQRGGFIKPFGCGWFIKECLLGHGPEGSPKINPSRGACQVDLFYYYKIALHRAYAQAAVDYENEQRVKQRKPIYTEQEYRERVDYLMSRMPYKLVKCRYHSFQRYFHWLKQLGWVEFTDEEEPAAIQEYYPEAPPRRYYRLTKKGIEASDREWSNPQLALYPQRGLEYYRNKRKQHRYSRKKPTIRRRR